MPPTPTWRLRYREFRAAFAVHVQLESLLDVIFGFPAVTTNCRTALVANKVAVLLTLAVKCIPLVVASPEAAFLFISAT